MSEVFEKNETYGVQMFHDVDQKWSDIFGNFDTQEGAQKVVDCYPQDRDFLRIVRVTTIREAISDE